MPEITIDEIRERVRQGYHMASRGQIFDDILVMVAEVDRLKAELAEKRGEFERYYQNKP